MQWVLVFIWFLNVERFRIWKKKYVEKLTFKFIGCIYVHKMYKDQNWTDLVYYIKAIKYENKDYWYWP